MSLLRNKWARPTLVVACCALALAACAGKPKKSPKLAYEERPVELLYDTGADRLDRHLWNQAVDYFQEVERQHPYSEWSRRAILMQAFAHYQANNYDEAIADTDRFISLYPGNQAAAYAHYLKAVCYFEQIVDVGRDQAATGQALDNLREVTQRYRGTEYARDALVKIDMVNDQLAGKEMTIGRYYLRQGDTLAAIGRFKTVIDRYQTTSHTPEALYRLVEAYLTLGLLDEAKKDGAVLGFNYPGDAWYADAYKLLTTKGLRPAVEPEAVERHGIFHTQFTKDKAATLTPPGAALPAPVSDDTAPASRKRGWLRNPFARDRSAPAVAEPVVAPVTADTPPAPRENRLHNPFVSDRVRASDDATPASENRLHNPFVREKRAPAVASPAAAPAAPVSESASPSPAKKRGWLHIPFTGERKAPDAAPPAAAPASRDAAPAPRANRLHNPFEREGKAPAAAPVPAAPVANDTAPATRENRLHNPFAREQKAPATAPPAAAPAPPVADDEATAKKKKKRGWFHIPFTKD